METILSLQEVSASYDHSLALSGVSIQIPRNRITAIIGPSGCGKSTLFRCMNRMLEEEMGTSVTGKIALAGKDIRQIPKGELRRRVALVFQTPTPFPFSIYKNMAYAPKYYGVRDKRELDRIVCEKLKLANLYEEVKDDLSKSALKLSGGQQQRLCLARALTVEPEVLLLDEPCSALDVKSSAIIEELLQGLKQDYTIVLVTHNIAQAKRLADQVAFLCEGRLVEYDDKDNFFAAPQERETRDFLSGVYS